MNGYTLDSPAESKNKRLRFILTPSYTWADRIIEEIKAADPLAFFVPIPKKFTDFHLDYPGLLGTVQNQIIPTDAMSIGDQIYMSLEMDELALTAFQILNEEKILLTGVVKYTFPYDAKTQFELASDIWLNF